MRGVFGRAVLVCASAVLAAACSTEPDITSVNLPSSSGAYRVGQPYEENGQWYYPREQPGYDEVGTASWYGPGFDGRLTADGEVYDANGLTAAHPTLPLPVQVRVTNLDNGHSLVLRVNDRGPFARGRIIDVSARAAQLLGFYDKGTARVRVTYLARADGQGAVPDVEDAPVVTATARAAPTAPVQMAALDPVAVGPIASAPPQTDTAQPDDTAADGGVPQLYVQAGTFSQLANAEHCRRRLAAAGNLTISSIDREGRLLYRVRVGPFDDIEAANAALARLTELGGSHAKIVADR
ncbi:MAG TPA: septal ring lytic transglycosylase RlpA family protein [Rhizomicrobium sp.]|jgi:rare lipoprotein A